MNSKKIDTGNVQCDRLLNANVCDVGYDDEMDGDFDVVGVYDEDGNVIGAMPRARGGRGSGRSPTGARGIQRGHAQTGRGGRGAGFAPPRPNLAPGIQAPPWWKGTSGVNQPNE